MGRPLTRQICMPKKTIAVLLAIKENGEISPGVKWAVIKNKIKIKKSNRRQGEEIIFSYSETTPLRVESYSSSCGIIINNDRVDHTDAGLESLIGHYCQVFPLPRTWELPEYLLIVSKEKIILEDKEVKALARFMSSLDEYYM